MNKFVFAQIDDDDDDGWWCWLSTLKTDAWIQENSFHTEIYFIFFCAALDQSFTCHVVRLIAAVFLIVWRMLEKW